MLSAGLLLTDGPEVSSLGFARIARPLLFAVLLAALGLALAETPARAATIAVTTPLDENTPALATPAVRCARRSRRLAPTRTRLLPLSP